MSVSVPSSPAIPPRILTALERLPPFSPVVRQVLASLSLEEHKVSLPAIGAQIEQDPLMAGRVLGIANSALYSRGNPIASVPKAAARLGLNRLRNVILSFSVNRIWGNLRAPSSFSMARFNLHSLATATAGEILSQRTTPENADHAFVAGLFHDIGELLMINTFPSEYSALLEGVPLAGEELEECERAKFGISHAEVSAAVTAYWNLPQSIQTAVQFHECPENATPGALSEITHAAVCYSDACGYSVADYPYPSDRIPDMLVRFGLEDDQIRPRFLQELSVLRAAA
jgi:HD-like signal output (HDOD) protein